MDVCSRGRHPARRPRWGWSWGVALMGAVLGASARAHSPHDVINATAVALGADGQLVVLGSGQFTSHKLMLRSQDGGYHWDLRDLPVSERDVSRIRMSPEFASDGLVFVGTTDTGLLRSLDAGHTWHELVDPQITIDDVAVSPFVASDGLVLCSGPTGVQRSVDLGAQWNSVDTVGLIESRLLKLAMARSGPSEFLTFGGAKTVHVSEDGGRVWTPLHTFPQKIAALEVSPRFFQDETLVVALQNGGGVHVSTDGGQSWVPMTGLGEADVNDVAISSTGALYAVTPEVGLHRATAHDQPFVAVGSGFEDLSDLTSDHYRTVDVQVVTGGTTRVVVGAFEGLFLSEDGGDTFRQGDIYSQRFNRRVVFDPDYAQSGQLYLVNYGGGLYRSPAVVGGGQPGPGPAPLPGSGGPGTGGHGSGASAGLAARDTPPQVQTWATLTQGISAVYGQELVLSPEFVDDRTMFYAQVGLWRSEDGGHSWTKLPLPAEIPVVRSVALSPDFAQDQTLFLGAGLIGLVYRSTDGGSTWEQLSGGLPVDPSVTVLRVSPDFTRDGTVYLGSKHEGIWRSTDGGDTWAPASNGYGGVECRSLTLSPDFAVDGTLFAGSKDAGLWRSTDGGDGWFAVNTGLSGLGAPIESIALSPDFANDGTAFVAALSDGVRRSVDGGTTWQPVGVGLPASPPRLVAVSPDFANDHTVAVSGYDWVWRSRDDGDTFERLPGYVRVDDVSNRVVYGGDWFTDPIDAHGAAAAESLVAGDSCELDFVGDRVRWFAQRGPDMGYVRVALDGALVATLDLYAPEPVLAPVFSHDFGATGWHVLRIENLGQSNPQSLGTRVVSDGFDYHF